MCWKGCKSSSGWAAPLPATHIDVATHTYISPPIATRKTEEGTATLYVDLEGPEGLKPLSAGGFGVGRDCVDAALRKADGLVDAN